nr:hypothetical protein [Deltaproteobacteria bacterium]
MIALLAGCSAEEATQVSCGEGVLCATDPDTGVRLDAAADRGPAVDRPRPNDLGPVRDAIAIRELTRIVVDPPTATLVSRAGASATQAFSVVGTFNDGTTRHSPAAPGRCPSPSPPPSTPTPAWSPRAGAPGASGADREGAWSGPARSSAPPRRSPCASSARCWSSARPGRHRALRAPR